MISKLTIFLVVAAAVSQLEASCPSKDPSGTGPIPNSNPNNNKAITPYHPCFRPMPSYLQLNYGGESKCEGGPTNNKCRNGECLDPYLPVCCQNAKGCNECSGKK